jgi:demethylspheroidene O-methyltransferase
MWSAGFVYSQVLLACVRLDLFEHPGARGRRAPAQLAVQLEVPCRPTQRLLDAAVRCALRLANARRRALRAGQLGAPMVGNEALAAMVEHHGALYADLRDPLALLRHEGARWCAGGLLAYAGLETPQALAPPRSTPTRP